MLCRMPVKYTFIKTRYNKFGFTNSLFHKFLQNKPQERSQKMQKTQHLLVQTILNVDNIIIIIYSQCINPSIK